MSVQSDGVYSYCWAVNGYIINDCVRLRKCLWLPICKAHFFVRFVESTEWNYALILSMKLKSIPYRSKLNEQFFPCCAAEKSPWITKEKMWSHSFSWTYNFWGQNCIRPNYDTPVILNVVKFVSTLSRLTIHPHGASKTAARKTKGFTEQVRVGGGEGVRFLMNLKRGF